MEHKLTTIRDELCRFIWLNEQERWEETCNALEQLENFGDELIPGLIECLSDGNPDVRHQAVRLLGAARPRSNVAVSDLIGMLQDEDWLIVTSTMFHLGAFGPLAGAAIPQIEPWLQSPNEFIRIQAATTILKLDPNRKEFLPMIWEATGSDNLTIQRFAREFLFE